jgi:hypothetical protein
MTREAILDDAWWELIEPLLPAQRSGRGRPMRDHRQVVEGIPLWAIGCVDDGL